ncbi:MAG: dihydropteroate synthase [Solirubrobacteraceae bacterium]
MSAPALELRTADGPLRLGGSAPPLLMGIVNASPDSFSDGGERATLAERVQLGRELHAAGATILDVGGESATTGRPPVEERAEIELVVPLIEQLAGDSSPTHPALVSVDTYKPAVADAAIAAGAHIVNDVSGLRDPELADVCARSGASLVLMHTAAAPRERRQDPGLYGDVTAEVLAFLADRIELALARGVDFEQLILDPGPDFAKTPAQTVRLLGELERLHELERPLLLAISRKDFIGALTATAPRERSAGTLAALADAADRGGHIFRMHDVQAAADFLRVRAALRGELLPGRDLALDEELRHERASRPRR